MRVESSCKTVDVQAKEPLCLQSESSTHHTEDVVCHLFLLLQNTQPVEGTDHSEWLARKLSTNSSGFDQIWLHFIKKGDLTCSSGEVLVYSVSLGSCSAQWFEWPFEKRQKGFVLLFTLLLQRSKLHLISTFFNFSSTILHLNWRTIDCIWQQPWLLLAGGWTGPDPHVWRQVALCSHTRARSEACLPLEWLNWRWGRRGTLVKLVE